MSALQGLPIGRMEFVLFTDKAPRAAESYRLMFSGEKVRNLGCDHFCLELLSLYAAYSLLLRVTVSSTIDLRMCFSTIQ